MRPASFSGSSFLLALTLLLGATFAPSAEAAPSAAGKAGAVKGASKSTSTKHAGGKGLTQKSAASAGAAADADPWDGAGPPAAGAATPDAAVPPDPPPQPPADEAPMDPRTAYHKGNAAFREGRFTAARHYYRLAAEGDPSFDVLCNLGRAEAELKDNVPAYVHLTQGLEMYPRDPELAATRTSFSELRGEVEERLTPEQRKRAEAMLAEGPPKPVTMVAAPAAATQPVAAPAPEVDHGPASPGVRTAVTLGLGSLALVGVGGGIGFLVYSRDIDAEGDAVAQGILGRDPDAQCPGADQDCDDLIALRHKSDDMQHVALGSFIAAGALATSAVLTYLLWPHEHGPAASASRPSTAVGRTFGHLRPATAFDPSRGSMWLGLNGRF